MNDYPQLVTSHEIAYGKYLHALAAARAIADELNTVVSANGLDRTVYCWDPVDPNRGFESVETRIFQHICAHAGPLINTHRLPIHINHASVQERIDSNRPSQDNFYSPLRFSPTAVWDAIISIYGDDANRIAGQQLNRSITRGLAHIRSGEAMKMVGGSPEVDMYFRAERSWNGGTMSIPYDFPRKLGVWLTDLEHALRIYGEPCDDLREKVIASIEQIKAEPLKSGTTVAHPHIRIKLFYQKATCRLSPTLTAAIGSLLSEHATDDA